MEGVIENLVSAMLGGGPQAIIAIMTLIIAALIWDRRRLVADITKKEAKIDVIIDGYYKGNLTLTEALNSLKILLFEMKGALRSERDH